MKWLVLLVALLVPSLAQAQEAEIGFYHQLVIEKGEEPTSRLFVQGYWYFGEKVGLWGFAYGEKQYISSVAGLYYDIFNFGTDAVFEVGGAVGAERFSDEKSGMYQLYPRFSGTVFVGNKTLFSEIYYENGTSRDGWLRVDTLWQVAKHVAVGVIHQTDDGTGPRVVLSVPKTPIRLWVSPMFGEGRKLLLGGELVFQKK